jgi:ABC-type transporter MlaC component
MSQTQRADFASVINRGGGKVDVLLNHLRQQ